jgi:hypothetical protein
MSGAILDRKYAQRQDWDSRYSILMTLNNQMTTMKMKRQLCGKCGGWNTC